MGQADGLRLRGLDGCKGDGDFDFMAEIGKVRPEFGKPLMVLFGDKRACFVEDMALVEAVDDFTRGQFEMARWALCARLPHAILKGVGFRWGDIPQVTQLFGEVFDGFMIVACEVFGRGIIACSSRFGQVASVQGGR